MISSNNWVSVQWKVGKIPLMNLIITIFFTFEDLKLFLHNRNMQKRNSHGSATIFFSENMTLASKKQRTMMLTQLTLSLSLLRTPQEKMDKNNPFWYFVQLLRPVYEMTFLQNILEPVRYIFLFFHIILQADLANVVLPYKLFRILQDTRDENLNL